MSKMESAMRVVLAFNDAFNRHDVAGLMQLMSVDCTVEHFEPAPDGAVYVGHEAVAQFWRDHFGDKQAAHVEIEEVFGLGKRCIMRWQFSWRAEDGEARFVRGVDVFRVSEGLIREKLSYVKG
jgi:ketosteroid isomerase-like protein